MIGKYTTNNIAEYKANPDLIYLSPRIMSTIANKPKIVLCAFCRAEISNQNGMAKKKFCDQICKDGYGFNADKILQQMENTRAKQLETLLRSKKKIIA